MVIRRTAERQTVAGTHGIEPLFLPDQGNPDGGTQRGETPHTGGGPAACVLMYFYYLPIRALPIFTCLLRRSLSHPAPQLAARPLRGLLEPSGKALVKYVFGFHPWLLFARLVSLTDRSIAYIAIEINTLDREYSGGFGVTSA